MDESTKEQKPVALREWAVAVKALAEGRQIVVMRKGGIAEETRDFQLLRPSFYLLPGFEHQKPELLKKAESGAIELTKSQWNPEAGTVPITAFAEVAEDIEIVDQESLDRIREHHIWTDTFAEERLKWKKTKPLHLLLLRVYRLEPAAEIPLRASYSGCKSWVELEDELPAAALMPVLSEAEFQAEAEKIRNALSR